MEEDLVEKVHNAYIQTDSVELDRLWYEESPKTFIKFFPANYNADGTNYFLQHIKEQTVWLASPSNFNDPFDCVINLDCRSETYQIAKEIVSNIMGEELAKEFFNSYFAKIGLEKISDDFDKTLQEDCNEFEERIYVTCFSEPDNLYSLRMWGHYANNHYGVCAEYDFNTVKDISPYACIPVKYSDIYSCPIYKKDAVNKTQSILNLIYSKAYEWKYEKEWRVANCLNKHVGKGFNSKCGLPKKIYLGCKIDERLKKDIFDVCIDKNIEIFQMKLRPGSYQLFYERLTEDKGEQK